MNNMEEKIAKVLSDKTFYEKYQDVTEAEELLKVVQEEVPEATREEIDEFLSKVSLELQETGDELNEAELEDVAGGFAVTFTVAGVCAVIKGAAIVGGAAGTLYWYVKHRKCI